MTYSPIGKNSPWPGGKLSVDKFIATRQICSMTLADFLRTNEMSPAAFAAELGVPASTITRIIRGERTPRLDTIQKIVAATSGAVTINDFVRASSTEGAVA
ncbi:helix-turn-helix domain-containing protein [Fulvimarina manganoxydans]|uniref:helix-turn-helix domain-containing protein n=1 Tax=Fulvimarina manganoxydans TaxID=937218 RepID=UPI000A009745